MALVPPPPSAAAVETASENECEAGEYELVAVLVHAGFNRSTLSIYLWISPFVCLYVMRHMSEKCVHVYVCVDRVCDMPLMRDVIDAYTNMYTRRWVCGGRTLLLLRTGSADTALV